MRTPLLRTTASADSIHVLGQDLRVLLSAADTGGTHSLFYLTVPPGDGPPPHIHSKEDETFIVLSGVLEFLVGSPLAMHRAVAGSCIFGPRGVPHTFRNPGPEPAHVLVLATPGGFENFGRAVATQFPADAAVDIPTLVRIMNDHGMTVLPPQ